MIYRFIATIALGIFMFLSPLIASNFFNYNLTKFNQLSLHDELNENISIKISFGESITKDLFSSIEP